MMSIKPDKTNSQPIMESVIQLFLGKILSGEWKAGDCLRPEREIITRGITAIRPNYG